MTSRIMRGVRTLVTVACAFGVVSVGAVNPATAGASTGAVPFTDTQSDGYIGFCDLAGNNVTSGSVTSRPFVWKAVSSVEQPAGYRGAGMNAALYIYQARPDVIPREFSGEQLDTATFYPSARYPNVQASYTDTPLSDTLKDFPPMEDGLYELRMEFDKAGYGDYFETYPTAVIQVTGDTWHVVQGGLVNCKKAVGRPETVSVLGQTQLPRKPIKDLTPPTAPPSDRATAGTQSTPSSAATGSPHNATQSNGSGSGLSGTGDSTDGRAVQVANDPISAPVAGLAQSGGISAATITIIVLACAVLLLIILLAAIRFRRRPAGSA